MATGLHEFRVAILATQGFEQVELTSPKAALEDAGATVQFVAPRSRVKAWAKDRWGDSFSADILLDEANPKDFNALLLPGGVMNADHLRMDPIAVDFVRSIVQAGKPVAAICHGPGLLIEADLVHGHEMTSYPALQTDLRNAGARWIDREVVVDGNFVTSRTPDDLDAFNREMIALFTTSQNVTSHRETKPMQRDFGENLRK